jgi:LacI family transcriptional regulator
VSMRTPPTLADVARAAGVSSATASRCLNGSNRTVRPETFDKVLRAARELRYQVNTSAQAVARGRSRTIALAVADIADPFNAAIATGVLRAAELRGRHVVISAGPDTVRLVHALRGQSPEAMVVVGSRRTDAASNHILSEALELYEGEGGAVTVVSQRGFPFNTIEIDNHALTRQLAVELVALGYRRFGVLAGPSDLVTATDRINGLIDGLAGVGLQVVPRAVVHSTFGREGGYRAVDGIVELGAGAVDVVFAVNDLVAVGAMTRLRERGVRVPDDVAIAGFDDMVIAGDVTPALTSVRIPMAGVGERAVEMALSPPGTALLYELVSGAPVIRASTPSRVGS